jgi:hypothetical protein
MMFRWFCLGVLVSMLAAPGCGGGGGGSDELEALVGDTNPPGSGEESPTPVGSLVLTTGADTIIADGSSTVLVRATVLSPGAQPIEGASVSFVTSSGGFQESDGANEAVQPSNAAGVAEAHLRSTTSPALAVITAQVGGFTREVEVRFVPGPADPAHSSLAANPAVIVADGLAETTVSASLADANGNPVADGTSMTLVATQGTIVSDNPAETHSGRVEFTLRAPTQQGTAQLSLQEVPGVAASVTFGVATSGEPAGIRLTVTDSEIAVRGVGQREEMQSTFQVVDAGGDPISEAGYADPAIDNLRITFATRPNGGEYLTGANAAGEVVTATGPEPLLIRTHAGSATVNLHSGTLPGSVELRAEFLVDADGSPLDEPIAANLPLVAIAAGPPHSIVLTYPVKDAIEPNDGVYRLVGKTIVNDRYGNPVPDGTAIHLGVLDSIIAQGMASTSAGNTTLTASPGDDMGGTVIRNDEPPRGIQQGDRVLLSGQVSAADKSRFAAGPPSADGLSIEVQTEYANDYAMADYVVGASLLGGHVLGTTDRGDFTTTTSGVSLTREGIADVIFDYPANVRTLNVGCPGVPAVDTRHEPLDSAQVLVVAESSAESGSPDQAVTVSPDFCFSPLGGFTLAALPSALAGSGAVFVVVRDGGDVRVAFTPVIASVEVNEAPEGAPFAVTATSCLTNEEGGCPSMVEILGDTLPGKYQATVYYQAGDGQTEVTVQFTR